MHPWLPQHIDDGHNIDVPSKASVTSHTPRQNNEFSSHAVDVIFPATAAGAQWHTALGHTRHISFCYEIQIIRRCAHLCILVPLDLSNDWGETPLEDVWPLVYCIAAEVAIQFLN